jgi:anti-sigma B factor antagonist
MRGGTQVLPEFGLEVDETRIPYTVLTIHGDLDLYTSSQVRERLVDLVDRDHRQVVINLDLVDFIDSAGLGVLVAGLKQLRRHDGDLSLVCGQRNILRLFELTGLTSLFRMTASVDEATGRIVEEKSEE